MMRSNSSFSFVRVALLLAAVVSATACATKRPFDPIPGDLYASGTVHLYQPLNPTTIWVKDSKNLEPGETHADSTSTEFKSALLRDLDTETVRISLSRVSGTASASAAVVGTSVKGESYVLVVDYIKYLTSNHQVKVTYKVTTPKETKEEKFEGKVPIYSGIGVRVRAEFVALEGGVNVSGLPALALAASANKISGRLTVQTLGVTGAEITPLMPVLSDISVSTIQAAVQAVAAIKAKLYEPSTVTYPKIVGFEAPARHMDAIPEITRFLYDEDLYVYPRVSPNPMKKGATILWLSWFSDPSVATPVPPATPLAVKGVNAAER